MVADTKKTVANTKMTVASKKLTVASKKLTVASKKLTVADSNLTAADKNLTAADSIGCGRRRSIGELPANQRRQPSLFELDDRLLDRLGAGICPPHVVLEEVVVFAGRQFFLFG